MKKTKRPYISKSDIENSNPSCSFSCAVHKMVERLGLLKGKCFGVNIEGIYIGPNKTLVESKMSLGNPDISFTEHGTNFINDFDYNRSVKPTRITLIDEEGKYF